MKEGKFLCEYSIEIAFYLQNVNLFFEKNRGALDYKIPYRKVKLNN
jgi:hypothetical protein